MELIEQLKKEHIEILQGFDVIRKGIIKGEFGDTDLINQLKDLKHTLIAHLDLEDKKLYPRLIDAGGEAEKLGEKYSEEMLEVSQIVFIFFGKYVSKTISNLQQSSEFRKELDDIMKTVSRRIEAEEKILYSAFEEYCNK